jgi:hypothetical protein
VWAVRVGLNVVFHPGGLGSFSVPVVSPIRFTSPVFGLDKPTESLDLFAQLVQLVRQFG